MSLQSEDQNLWKENISGQERIHHELLFYSQGPVDGYLSGERARDLFLHSRLSLTVLSQIWNLADVSNDNVLSVEEFVLAMHLILKVKEGLPIPRALPKHLVPKSIPATDIAQISDKETKAYQNVFNKLSSDQINAIQGRQLLLESALSIEELSHVWDLSDINRDGQLDRNEWNVSCHLVRHLKQGGKLSGPVNVFQLIPQCLSPVCYQARKHRVEEYNKKKHHLMTLKEKRKSQIDCETRRLELLKKRFALHKELYEFSKSSEGGVTIPEEEYNLYKAKEESNIEKVEAVIYRLKKEHESIRQQTVKVILGEQGSLNEDARLLKLEQEDVRQKLATYHTKATKDPDPFHQLYELRRDLRKRSTLSEGEEPEVHFPCKTNPFDKETLQPKLTGHSIFISPDPSVFNNNNSHKEAAILKELCEFGDGFVDKWCEGASESDLDLDPIFMSINVPMDNRSWSGVTWSDSGSEKGKGLHQKLVDLKIEMQKLNDDNGGQLLFRNPEDYLARQKAQEEEEKLEKSRYQRRYSDKRSDKDVSKRKSYIAPHTPDDEAHKLAREYRQKRRSLNLDKRSENSEKLKTDKQTVTDKGRKQSSSEKKSNAKPLKISTDSTDGFTPESASSPRSPGVTSPRSATSPPRPSTKRKAAPPPPVASPTSSTPSGATKVSSKSTPVQQTTEDLSSNKPIPQPISPQSKIPKPVTNQEPQNSTPNTPQTFPEPIVSVQSDNSLNTPNEIQNPSRPPRRKKRSIENKSFLHESFEKEQVKKSKEIALNVDLKDSPIESSIGTSEGPESKTGDLFTEHNSYDVKDDSLLDTIIKELPTFQKEKPGEEVDFEQTTKTKDDIVTVNGTVEEVIVANLDAGIECEIKPVKVDKQRGRFIESKGVYKIELTDKQLEPDTVNADDSEDEKEFVINRQHQNERKISLDSVEPDNCVEYIKPETYNKKSEDLLQTFDKIAAYPNRNRSKDTKDTISIASDISISSAGSEAPPLPDSAPPPLPVLTTSHPSYPSSEAASQREEVVEEMDIEVSKQFETSPNMSQVPDVSEKANVREVVSPINDLKASMFSMRVTSPTRDMPGDVHTNGELTVDTNVGKNGENSDSDISDSEDVIGNFTPGEKITRDVPMVTNEDDGGIQLVSYNTKLNSPNSDQSGPDSAFEDMQSSMTSNDPLSNTMDEFSPEEYVTVEKVEKVESTPKKEVKSFVLEFDTDIPKGGPVLSPTSNKNFMAKAQQFADSVQRPPKMTVKLKREIQSPQDLTDERYLLLEAERRAVINSSTVKKKNVVSSVSVEEDATVDRPDSPEPEDSIQEWRTEVSKRSNIPWEEKPEKVNLYSENIIQETENTEAVDRESIANLSKARQQWETKAEKTGEESTPRKQKQPQQVRHWEVKLPTTLKRVPADVIRTTKSDSDSETENMADTEHANESAIEREIRLAMEREELLKKEQEERASLQERQQVSSVKKEPFEKIEQNNNKPTYHEMTEADRGSELQQREELIQQELQEQQEREAAYRGDTRTVEDSSPSSAEEDENANESIIEREIRLQQERERELEERRQQLARTNIKNEKPVVEETVTVEYTEVVETVQTPASTMSRTPVSTPDVLSEAEDQAESKTELKARISYEEAISSAAHDGESLIARELREAREREEELKKQRQLTANTNKATTPKQTTTPTSVKQSMTNENVDNQKPSYQKDVSPFKNERRQSTDSLSSGHSSEKPKSSTPRGVRVTFGGGGKMANLTYKTPDKPKETKRQETPIEREIRLARERENEYRVSKGLPPLKDEAKIDYDIDNDDESDDKKESVTITKSSFFSSPSQQNKGESIQKFASSRLQKEINKQNALEKKYREEGKIKSTSEDHLGQLKYTDIATQEQSSVPKRNFSITRKSAPVAEQKQNGAPESKSTKALAPDQPAPKFNRSVSGGVTFSYKESRHKAESKIEQELREMREREEELRSQRSGSGVVSPRSPRSPDTTSVVNKRSQFEQTS